MSAVALFIILSILTMLGKSPMLRNLEYLIENGDLIDGSAQDNILWFGVLLDTFRRSGTFSKAYLWRLMQYSVSLLY